jgi:hypothetical protein
MNSHGQIYAANSRIVKNKSRNYKLSDRFNGEEVCAVFEWLISEIP